MEDGQIVDLYLQRKEQAVDMTAEKYGGRLKTVAYGIVKDLETAQECENDTYLEAWKSIPPHEPRTYLYAFLVRITRHIALNCCRERQSLKRRAHLCELSQELEQCIAGPEDVEQHMDELFLRKTLNAFLGDLEREKRIIFIRRYWYLDSIRDIAATLGISESKVKTTLHRCRKMLRSYLEKEGYIL